MRVRTVSVLLIITLFAGFVFTGCDRNAVTKMDLDDPVAIEDVNKSSAQVVRAYFESIYTSNREIFEKCYPETFISELKDEDIDLYDEYTQSLVVPGTFIGTQYLKYNELSKEGGYDDYDLYIANIAEIQGVDAAKIESMQIVAIKVYFEVDGENKYLEVYSIAYCLEGSWYMYEIQDSSAEFKN